MSYNCIFGRYNYNNNNYNYNNNNYNNNIVFIFFMQSKSQKKSFSNKSQKKIFFE